MVVVFDCSNPPDSKHTRTYLQKRELSNVYTFEALLSLNVGGPQRLNRYEFGLKFCEILDYPKGLIEPTEMVDLPELSDRPADCSMDISRLKEALDHTPKTVSEGLQSMARSR